MEMAIIFLATHGDDHHRGEVIETGEGDTEAECIDHATAKMIGRDFDHIEVLRHGVTSDARKRGGRGLYTTSAERMHGLIATFPALEGFTPTIGKRFDATGFAGWAGEAQLSDGGMYAALFVLSVWNDRADWSEYGCKTERHGGRFYLHDAMGCWDPAQRAAFAAWASNPFWC
jgi:hypothetical protein